MSKPKSLPKSKHWCLTINNPEEGDDTFPTVWWNPAQMDYLILGQEVGENGTHHLQGYVIFKIRKQLSAVKKTFPRAHLEIKRGKCSEAAAYCMKDDKFTEWGELPADNAGAEGTKRKWAEVRTYAKDGKFEDIPDDVYIRYFSNIHGIHAYNPPKLGDLAKRNNYWVVAPSGHGKSTYVRRRWPDYYDKAPNKWWTGYKGEPAVICDDFGPNQCKYLGWLMKRWADRFSFPAEVKCSQLFIRPKNIIVTSQYSIDECFAYDPKLCSAINNRFNVIQLKHHSQRIQPLMNVD